jgi:hypothetical protein
MDNGWERLVLYFKGLPSRVNSLIMLRYTTVASLAVSASEGSADHTSNAEVGLVKLPQAEKIVDDSLLLGNPIEFRDKARVEQHAGRIEVSRRGINSCEKEVE